MRISKKLRLIAMMLVAMLVLAACSSSDDGTDESSEGADTSEETAPEGEDGDDDTAATEDAPSTGSTTGSEGSTLQATLDAGVLKCGVNGQLNGFSLDEGGTYSGLDVDYCKAVAAAVPLAAQGPAQRRFVAGGKVPCAQTFWMVFSRSNEFERKSSSGPQRAHGLE